MIELIGGPLDGMQLDKIQDRILQLLSLRAARTGESQPFAFVRDGVVQYIMIRATDNPDQNNHFAGPE